MCGYELLYGGTTKVEPPARLSGVSHVALVTPDMDATVRFYVGALGMRLHRAMSTPAGRHYFFEAAPRSYVAFFEWPEARTRSKPAGMRTAEPFQLDHLSFSVAGERVLGALQERLRGAGVEVTDVVEHGPVRAIYFTDNNGIALEACCAGPGGEGESGEIVDPAPVAAVEELVRDGHVAWTPVTRLVREPQDAGTG